MATKLLLVQDVEELGRSGDIVSVKPGYARNFLLPQGFGVNVTASALRMQEKLQEERRKRAIEDKKDSEALASKIESVTVKAVVKVDHDGRMYGSVSAQDILHLLQEQASISLEKKNIQLKHAIKETGVHPIVVKLKEGVTAAFTLKIVSEDHQEETQEDEKAEA